MSYKQPLWDIVSPRYLKDESTNEYRWRETRTEGQTSGATTLRVKIDDTSNFMLFSESLLQVDFEVSATELNKTKPIALPNAWSLFRGAQIMFNGKQVAQTSNPAVISHMSSLHKYSRDYTESVADTEMFYPIAKKDLEPSLTTALGVPIANTAGNRYMPVEANGALINLVDTSLTGVTAGTFIWLPRNDPSAETQVLFKFGVIALDGGGLPVSAPVTRGDVSDLSALNPSLYRRNPNYDPDFARSKARLLENVAANKSVCSVMLPLRVVFPVMSQVFDRANRGVRFELELLKNTEIASVFYAPDSTVNLAFDIKRCSVWCPVLFPSLEAQTLIESQIATTGMLTEPYEQCEINSYPLISSTAEQNVRLAVQKSRVSKILVAFQLQEQVTNIRRNPLQFDDPGVLAKLELRVNGAQYPLEQYTTNSEVGSRQGLVRMLRDVFHSNNKSYDYENGGLLTYDSFVSGAHRVYMLDATFMNQDPFRKSSVSDIELRFTHRTAGVAFTVHALMVSEAEMKTTMLKGQMVQSQM